MKGPGGHRKNVEKCLEEGIRIVVTSFEMAHGFSTALNGLRVFKPPS